MRDPFPEDVWELILDKLEDPRDAWNVFKAFPHLDLSAALQKKKRIWLFGLVLPHLLPEKHDSWLEESDLWNCRLVCWQWSVSVDTFLEEQPQLRAYPLQSVQTRLFGWNLKPYLDTAAYYCEHLGGTKFYKNNLSGGPGQRSLKRFVREIDSHPPGRNPFLSRSLFLWLTDRDDTEYVQKMANDVNTLLQKCGVHVWFFQVTLPIGGISAACIAEAIRYLPNLRSLEVQTEEGNTPDPDDEDRKSVV